MEQRELGRSGIKVSAIGLGLMSMSGIYGNADDEESIGVIHYALERGVNHLDSSDMYGWGHNETLLGRALKGGWREKALVVTKFGQVKGADGKQGVDGRPEYVMQACEASLKRLGVDVIDLYYQHLSLIHISEPTRLLSISYAVFCLKKKKYKYIYTKTTNS